MQRKIEVSSTSDLKERIGTALIKNLLADDCSGYTENDDLKNIYKNPEYSDWDPVYEIHLINGNLILEFGWNIRSEWNLGQQVCYLQLKSIMKEIIGW